MCFKFSKIHLEQSTGVELFSFVVNIMLYIVSLHVCLKLQGMNINLLSAQILLCFPVLSFACKLQKSVTTDNVNTGV
jgi:hypothetical protein